MRPEINQRRLRKAQGTSALRSTPAKDYRLAIFGTVASKTIGDHWTPIGDFSGSRTLLSFYDRAIIHKEAQRYHQDAVSFRVGKYTLIVGLSVLKDARTSYI